MAGTRDRRRLVRVLALGLLAARTGVHAQRGSLSSVSIDDVASSGSDDGSVELASTSAPVSSSSSAASSEPLDVTSVLVPSSTTTIPTSSPTSTSPVTTKPSTSRLVTITSIISSSATSTDDSDDSDSSTSTSNSSTDSIPTDSTTSYLPTTTVVSTLPPPETTTTSFDTTTMPPAQTSLTPTDTPKGDKHSGMIAGITIGAVALVAGIGIVIWFFRKWLEDRGKGKETVDPNDFYGAPVTRAGTPGSMSTLRIGSMHGSEDSVSRIHQDALYALHPSLHQTSPLQTAFQPGTAMYPYQLSMQQMSPGSTPMSTQSQAVMASYHQAMFPQEQEVVYIQDPRQNVISPGIHYRSSSGSIMSSEERRRSLMGF
ncbi:hypothetical protein T439DRAFT_353820 [Meredithblackwellia eburnea MCA 4105]